MCMVAGQAKSYCQPFTSRKFRGVILINSLNIRHIFRIPAVRLLDTLLWERLASAWIQCISWWSFL